MHDPNYEHASHRGPRSAVDRHAINLVGGLLVRGVRLERRLTRTLTPRRASNEATPLRAPPGANALTGVLHLRPLRGGEA